MQGVRLRRPAVATHVINECILADTCRGQGTALLIKTAFFYPGPIQLSMQRRPKQSKGSLRNIKPWENL